MNFISSFLTRMRFSPLASSAFWAAVAAIFAATAAWLTWSQQRSDAINAIRPEIVLSNWAFSPEENKVAEITFTTIENVGRGPAFQIFAELKTDPETDPSFGSLLPYPLTFLREGDRKNVSFTGTFTWKDAMTDPDGKKLMNVKIIITYKDINGHYYETSYVLLAMKDEIAFYGGEKLYPGLYLLTRHSIIR